MIKVITSRNPAFLKATYACPEVDLQNHDWFVEPMEKFITWDGEWVVKVMLPERVARFCGRYPELRTALFYAKQ
jgi:hypothetical protein